MLFASLLWGSVGLGYFVFGRRQRSWVPMLGGLAVIVVSYLAGSILVMSLISIGIIAAIHFLLRQGY